MSMIQLDIVSAEQALFSGKVQSVIVSGSQGELGIMPGHTPLLSALKPGAVQLKHEQGDEESFYVSGGMIEVQPYHVTILADTAQRAHDLDEEKALEAEREARRKLSEQSSDFDHSAALAELAEAAAQVRLIREMNRKAGR